MFLVSRKMGSNLPFVISPRQPRDSMDALVRRDRFRHAGRWLLGAGLILAILVAAALVQLPAQTREINGVALGVVGTPSDDGHRLYLRVRLSSGHEVIAKLPRGSRAVAGDSVVVSEATSLFGGVPRYRFLRTQREEQR